MIAALAGPTASGKTQLAIQLAESIGGEIVSVDSGAVYRGLDIGAAKPDSAARARVRHHLLDIRNPDQPFSAGDFCRMAKDAIADIQRRGRVPILAGGSMMYFRALSGGMHSMPAAPLSAQSEVRAEMKQRGAAAMHRLLQKADPATAAKLHPSDSQRIGRALEVWRGSGRRLSELLESSPSSPMQLSAIVLIPNRELLRENIALRLKKMFADGLVEETAAAVSEFNLTAESPGLRLAGYKQAAMLLRGECDETTMRRRAFFATCQLAKRQTTWLRRWPAPLATIDPFAPEAEKKIAEAARQWKKEYSIPAKAGISPPAAPPLPFPRRRE